MDPVKDGPTPSSRKRCRGRPETLREIKDDVEARLPVWSSLQVFFLDTDPAELLGEVAEACAKSPYQVDELEKILFNEVMPALRFNCTRTGS